MDGKLYHPGIIRPLQGIFEKINFFSKKMHFKTKNVWKLKKHSPSLYPER